MSKNISFLSVLIVCLASLAPTACTSVDAPPPETAAAPAPLPEPTPAPEALPQENAEIVDEMNVEQNQVAETAADAGVEEIVDPEALQQQALDLCQSATEFLDQGDVDEALAALDHAYELMLQLPNNGDETYLQAREDIRRLVADLIVNTYDSQKVAFAPKTSLDLEITLIENDHVKREIKSFTNGERQVFIDAYRRSGLYRQMMLEKLDAAGLPSQLSWLPLVESNFKVKAYSRASAVGLWQFISSTGQRYGLARDAWVDERMDPEKATDAAIAYLTELHNQFGDWPKALAAYNCGEGRVARLQRRNPSEYLDFWDLYNLLPRETRRYVPRLFATLMIVKDPAAYGMQLPEPAPPLPAWQAVKINRTVKLDKIEESLSLSKGTLVDLNPELRHAATPKKPYTLKVPVGLEATLLASVDTLPEWNPPTPAYSTHRVQRGETLSRIAQRYRTSVGAIMRSNNLRSAHRIYPGQRLSVPVHGGSAPSGPSFNPAEGTHTVRRGESLYSIARRYSTTVDRIKRDNNLGSNTIHPGRKLKVAAGSRTDLKRHTVRSGDTAGRIAQTYGISLSALLRANGLSSRSTIYPGQVLVVP